MKSSSNQLKIKQLVLDIMAAAMEKTEATVADVFVDYQAHVNEISVRIYTKGWNSWNSHNYTEDKEEKVVMSSYIDREEANVINQLEEILATIKAL